MNIPQNSKFDQETSLAHASCISLPSFDSHKSFLCEERTTLCPICYDAYPVSKVVKSLECDHSFCKACITEYLKARINSLKVINIPCPFSGCSQVFPAKIIEQIVDQTIFKQYQDLLLKKTINRNLEVKFCPKPGCSKPFTPSLKHPYTICKCKTKICNTCCNSWHEGKTCLQAIDPDFELYALKEDIKFCVMCKTYVQKVEGCKHITCPICDYEWCWDCGKEYKKDHQAGCPGKWSPTPPSFSTSRSLREKWTRSSIAAKIGITICLILISPVLFCGLFLLWPLWLYFDPQTSLSINRPFKSLGIILVCMALGVILTPFIIFGIGLALFISPLFYLRGEYNGPQQQTNTVQKEERWKKRDPNNFTYTSNARPVAAQPRQAALDLTLVTFETSRTRMQQSTQIQIHPSKEESEIMGSATRNNDTVIVNRSLEITVQ